MRTAVLTASIIFLYLNAIVDELNALITKSIPDLTPRMNRANVPAFPMLEPVTK